jgi:recombination protein RecR
MRYPEAVQNLINLFSQLPTVGPKTAERYVFYLLKQDPNLLRDFGRALSELKEKTVFCERCGAIAAESPCSYCSDVRRQENLLCVVANTQDFISLEATGQYHGYYFILGGLINTIENIGPADLRVEAFIRRLKENKVKEVILALSPTVEGETTALYLAKILKQAKVKATRLARGLPTGSNLEYADELTLVNALKYRNEI